MIEAPLALAFATGMVATVNPCGFAMLPAYLSYFLGSDDAPRSLRAGVAQSLRVGLAVSAGFLAVFGLAGLAFHHLSAPVYRWAPWLTIPVGVVLVVLGVAMLRGFDPVVALPKLQRGGRDRTVRSMFVFGVSYAIASLSCALPLFLGMVAGTFQRENLQSSLAAFAAYGLGMSLVLVTLTVSLGLARQGVLRTLRRVMPRIVQVSGALLVVAGAYVAYYGWYELRLQRDGPGQRSRVVERVTGWSDDAYRWIIDFGPTRLGLLLALLLAGVLTAALATEPTRRK